MCLHVDTGHMLRSKVIATQMQHTRKGTNFRQSNKEESEPQRHM